MPQVEGGIPMKVWKGQKHVGLPAPANGLDWLESRWKGRRAGGKNGDQAGRDLTFTLRTLYFANSTVGPLKVLFQWRREWLDF